MNQGTVLTYNRLAAFGWIIPDAGGSDIFFHFKGFVGVRYVSQGQRVSYEIGEFKQRPTAVNIRVIAASAPESGARQESAKETYEYEDSTPMSERIAAVARRRAPIGGR